MHEVVFGGSPGHHVGSGETPPSAGPATFSEQPPSGEGRSMTRQSFHSRHSAFFGSARQRREMHAGTKSLGSARFDPQLAVAQSSEHFIVAQGPSSFRPFGLARSR